MPDAVRRLLSTFQSAPYSNAVVARPCSAYAGTFLAERALLPGPKNHKEKDGAASAAACLRWSQSCTYSHCRVVYVRNLPFNISSEEMYDIFGKYGALRQVRIGDSKDTRGTAFVVYEVSTNMVLGTCMLRSTVSSTHSAWQSAQRLSYQQLLVLLKA